jgi:hypothetical protein
MRIGAVVASRTLSSYRKGIPWVSKASGRYCLITGVDVHEPWAATARDLLEVEGERRTGPVWWTIQAGAPAGSRVVVYVKRPIAAFAWIGRTLSASWRPAIRGHRYSYAWVELYLLDRPLTLAEAVSIEALEPWVREGRGLQGYSLALSNAVWNTLADGLCERNPWLTQLFDEWDRSIPEAFSDPAIEEDLWYGPAGSPYPYTAESQLQEDLLRDLRKRGWVAPSELDPPIALPEWEPWLSSRDRADLLVARADSAPPHLRLIEAKLFADLKAVDQARRYIDALRSKAPGARAETVIAALTFTAEALAAAARAGIACTRIRWSTERESSALFFVMREEVGIGRATDDTAAAIGVVLDKVWDRGREQVIPVESDLVSKHSGAPYGRFAVVRGYLVDEDMQTPPAAPSLASVRADLGAGAPEFQLDASQVASELTRIAAIERCDTVHFPATAIVHGEDLVKAIDEILRQSADLPARAGVPFNVFVEVEDSAPSPELIRALAECVRPYVASDDEEPVSAGSPLELIFRLGDLNEGTRSATASERISGPVEALVLAAKTDTLAVSWTLDGLGELDDLRHLSNRLEQARAKLGSDLWIERHAERQAGGGSEPVVPG